MLLHLDFETFSSVDISTSGAYKYTASPDFEILLTAFAMGDDAVEVHDGPDLPKELISYLKDDRVTIAAHNAVFERLCLRAYGYDLPPERFLCTAVQAASNGLPLSLADVSKALKLGDDKAKMAEGKALIRYFCVPCKPTRANGYRTRNARDHNLTGWEKFREYCARDVEAEREAYLLTVPLGEYEREVYAVDQHINDRGVLVDTELAAAAIDVNERYTSALVEEVKDITGLDNPNSPAQLKKWLGAKLKTEVTTIAAESLEGLEGDEEVSGVVEARKKLSKSSVKKYSTMLSCKGGDGRARGLLQFCGAGRTGRWAGRLVQVQNLPRNHMDNLDLPRELVRRRALAPLNLLYDNVADVLSQLVRTAFIAPPGKVLAVADYSAIEARVTAWLAGEEWRMEVFRTHGKIYEASAAMMFGVPIESVTKGSDLRQKGKVAELALGYQGSVGALVQMGGADMGLTKPEMENIVARWRKANPNIVGFWEGVEDAAKRAIATGRGVRFNRFYFRKSDNGTLHIGLPSDRVLRYREAKLGQNRFGGDSIIYMGMDQTKKIWGRQETYGGKLTENIVQAVSRDLLAHALVLLHRAGVRTVMHIHDETVNEVDALRADDELARVCRLMEQAPSWAEGLPLRADGFTTAYYKKD